MRVIAGPKAKPEVGRQIFVLELSSDATFTFFTKRGQMGCQNIRTSFTSLPVTLFYVVKPISLACLATGH